MIYSSTFETRDRLNLSHISWDGSQCLCDYNQREHLLTMWKIISTILPENSSFTEECVRSGICSVLVIFGQWKWGNFRNICMLMICMNLELFRFRLSSATLPPPFVAVTQFIHKLPSVVSCVARKIRWTSWTHKSFHPSGSQAKALDLQSSLDLIEI